MDDSKNQDSFPNKENSLKPMVWNLYMDRNPSRIFTCKTERDVVNAVRYASKYGLKVTVQGEGYHSTAKKVKDGTILIDLSPMNEVHIDEISKIATVGPGARIFEIDMKTQEYGLATPLGVFSNIGVYHFALRGGFGYLRGMFGLTSDNIVGVNLVTGYGQLIYVNRFEHPELFWAIRGAGNKFGVVTKFEFKLHPVGQHVLGIDVVYDYKDIKKIINNAEIYRQTAVDEITFHLVLSNKKDKYGEKKVVHLFGMYIGKLNIETEENIIQPLLELATPIEDNIEVMTFIEMQKKFDRFVQDEVPSEGFSLYFAELNQEVIEILTNEFETTDLQIAYQLIELHGQINRITEYETAVPIRKANYLLFVTADIREFSDEVEKWIDYLYRKLFPYSYSQTEYLYSNNVIHEAKKQYCSNFERLQRLKKEYDPDNLFDSYHKYID